MWGLFLIVSFFCLVALLFPGPLLGLFAVSLLTFSVFSVFFLLNPRILHKAPKLLTFDGLQKRFFFFFFFFFFF